MRFGILGPLAVWRNGSEVPIGAAKQRALLALLLIRRGELVPIETLVDELWGARPPPTAVKALRTYVSRLRKTLGEQVLETRPSGYRLRLDRDALDSARFEDRLAQARDLLAGGSLHEAHELLREALALWRGPPLAEFRYEAFARDEIARLEELRLVALEQRLETDIALGHHAMAVPELESLVAEHPLRETLVALLMLALYRSGRQAEALDVYRDARAALVEQLGLEPGGTLKELERAILTHAPALDLDVPPASRRPWRRRMLLALMAIAVAAAAIAVGVILTRGGTSKPLSRLAPNSIAVVDPDRNALVDAIPFDTRPAAVAVANGALWVAMQDDETLLRIDPHTRKVTRTIGLGAAPLDLAATAGHVWVLCGWPTTLVEVDTGTNTVIRRIVLKGVGRLSVSGFRGGRPPNSIAAGTNAAWLPAGPGLVMRIDAATGNVEHIGTGFAVDVAVGDGAIWTVGSAFDVEGADVSRIDPHTRRVTEKVHPPNGSLANWANGIAADASGVWVIDETDAMVWKVDPGPARVSAIIRVHGPLAIAIGEGAVWTANTDGTVTHIDPSAAAAVKTIPLGSYPRLAYPVDLAAGEGAVWVAVH